MLEEFRKFALRGNVVDLAVGIIIGAAFTAIVNSLVNDIIMPPLGAAMGGLDFSDYYLQLTMRGQTFTSLLAARNAGAAVIAYGAFINAIIRFMIVAFALFIIIREMNRLRDVLEKQVDPIPETAPPLPPEVRLLTEIRDLLQRSEPPPAHRP